MKKILFIIDSLTCGGAEKSLISLLPLLDYNKMEVDLMLGARGGIFEQYIPQNINICTIPKKHSLLRQYYYSFLLRLYKFFKIAKHPAEIHWAAWKESYLPLDKEYDMAIAYQQGLPTYYVASKVKAKKKCAWINADIHKAGYDEKFNEGYYKKMDYVVPVSEVLSNMLQKMNYFDNKKIYPVYDILNVNLIQEMSKEAGFTNSLPQGTWRILTVGRLAKPKNYPLAVETAKILKEKGISFKWYFVGEGSERQNIEALISKNQLQDHVILFGMKANPYPYMAGCDIYVQTSSFEGFGLTLCEARLLHKPEVSTNFPVVYNQIQDGVNGLIAEMNAESVAEKITVLITDHALRESIIQETKKEINNTSITESKKVNALLLS